MGRFPGSDATFANKSTLSHSQNVLQQAQLITIRASMAVSSKYITASWAFKKLSYENSLSQRHRDLMLSWLWSTSKAFWSASHIARWRGEQRVRMNKAFLLMHETDSREVTWLVKFGRECWSCARNWHPEEHWHCKSAITPTCLCHLLQRPVYLCQAWRQLFLCCNFLFPKLFWNYLSNS